MGLGLLFSGQGLQHADMLPWLDDQTPAMRAVAERFGADWRVTLAEPLSAGRNAWAQPLLTALALAAWAQLAPGLPEPVAIAGQSVGELAAFAVAGAFDASGAVALADARARAMDACAAGLPPTGLLGVSGLSPAQRDALCARWELQVAIDSGPDSAVLGGTREALAAGARDAQERNARCTLLNVAMASHTSWLQAAADAFDVVLRDTPIRPTRIVLFSNFSGDRVSRPDDLRHTLAAQIAHRVRWADCMRAMAERQVDCVLEIGGGDALARQWRQQHPAIPARSADEFRGLDSVRAWCLRHLDRR